MAAVAADQAPSSPVLPLSSNTSPAANVPSSPLDRVNSTAATIQPVVHERPQGMTPYQWAMAVEAPFPLQAGAPKVAVATFGMLMGQIPRLARAMAAPVGGKKAIFCPYLKNKGTCKFAANRCTYSHDRRLANRATATSSAPAPAPAPAPATVPLLPSKENVAPSKKVGEKAIYKAYEPRAASKNQVLRLSNRESAFTADQLMVKDRKSGELAPRHNLRELWFESRYGKVQDEDLKKIVDNENLARSLSLLSVVDAGELTDEAIFNLSQHTDLRVIILNGASKLTDAALIALCVNCKNIEYLEITGTRKTPGMMRSAAFRILRQSSTLGAMLKEIVLKNHTISSKEALELSIARPKLAITMSNIPGTEEEFGTKHFFNRKQASSGTV
ncbi:hypothetical protein TWF281_006827 [Arthrobotrys megalospora]